MNRMRTNVSNLTAAVALALVALSTSARADMFYGGDWDGRTGLSDELNTAVSDARVYDNFSVAGPGWNVNQLFGRFFTDPINPVDADWEIRSGVSVGTGGTLIASGNGGSGFTWLPTGTIHSSGLVEYELRTNVSFNLAPGDYHLMIRPVGTGTGRAFLSTTSGQNGIGSALADGNAIFDSTYWANSSWISVNDIHGEGTWDYSQGIGGSVIPAPGAALLGLVGLPLVAWFKRRLA